jgi:hypothetical protein
MGPGEGSVRTFCVCSPRHVWMKGLQHHRPEKVGTGQVGAGQICRMQIGTAQDGTRQVGAGKGREVQIGTGQVGSNAGTTYIASYTFNKTGKLLDKDYAARPLSGPFSQDKKGLGLRW